ncbi:hypothetical protein BDV40DRAFT_307297 [Aspergillus tamarii]|uniref:Six-hairpin glycosidase-like protein n=1 Tax=Aspergillus tamarii TaxID=41984 RepID=A0A5N6VD66_ASPTM|nr:hypothetical protein BDV40DRAFT_307297 [Aspergillus tamarii]
MHLQSRILLCIGSLGLANAASTTFNLTSFNGELAEDSGVLRSLRPTTDPLFDFGISGVFDSRNGDGNYHTGDISLKWRRSGEETSPWTEVSSAANRSIVPVELPTDQGRSEIARTDLSVVFAASGGLNVTRTWADYEGDLVLMFDIENDSDTAIELGGLSLPLEVNNIFTGREPEYVLQQCSFIDPYFGLDAGYAQVRRLSGKGPNMVITPFAPGTRFEGWQFLEEEKGHLDYQSWTYEGNYAWLVHTEAYSQEDWGDATPWNEPSSRVIKPGESVPYGLRFTLVPSVTDIESTVANLGLSVAVGIPGYIITGDMRGSLFLNSSTAPSAIHVSPGGALEFTEVPDSPASPWIEYSVTAGKGSFGRALVTISYQDGSTHALHYWVNADPAGDLIDKIGTHISEKQWYTDDSDPFNRAPSILSYNKETDDFIIQENRTWIAGLSDEGGAGSFVAFAMKQVISPDPGQIRQLEQFVNQTVWGFLQHSEGEEIYGVAKSLFFYAPNAMSNFSYDSSISWGSAWNKAEADRIDRAYNYVWVSLLYWALYKADRVSPGVLSMDPIWYLQQAAATVDFALGTDEATQKPNTLYSDLGLMGESIWGDLLDDLRHEDMQEQADGIKSLLQSRQQHWAQSNNPFKSEASWDCTGQEAVYYWSQYFNDTGTCNWAIQTIRGYDLTVPHWGYNGNARRYWDFLIAGNPATAAIERQIHHYGSSLNAVPLLDYYRRSDNPTSLESIYDLRMGYGGQMASLTNIDEDGFGSMAFHSYPHMLTWDSYTGDYGPSFVGHYQTAASYLVSHPDFGWIAFGGNVNRSSSAVEVTPTDSLQRRVYVAHLGLWVVLESARIESFAWSESEKALIMDIKPTENGSRNTIMWKSDGKVN